MKLCTDCHKAFNNTIKAYCAEVQFLACVCITLICACACVCVLGMYGRPFVATLCKMAALADGENRELQII